MTFEDHITPEHYRELLAAANPINAKWSVWTTSAILIGVGLAVLGAMGAFFYAAVVAVMKKGLAGTLAEPFTLFLISAGLVTCIAGLIVLAYKRNTLKLIWKNSIEPDIAEMDLREGLNLGPARYTLSDQGVRVEMPLDIDEIKWSAFINFRETANGLMLMFNRTHGMVVPKGQLVSDGAYPSAVAIVSGKLKRAT